MLGHLHSISDPCEKKEEETKFTKSSSAKYNSNALAFVTRHLIG